MKERPQTASSPSDLPEEAPVVSAEARLAEAEGKAAEYLEGWQRARADFANFRRRVEKEREELSAQAAAEALTRILPVIDDFERAMSALPTERSEEEPFKGFLLIHRKLLSLLEGAGITVLDPQGQPFNPAQHEALGQDEAGAVAVGHVTAVLQKGYALGERVLRPALVRVAQ
jgi:molecular chaperone GrpE